MIALWVGATELPYEPLAVSSVGVAADRSAPHGLRIAAPDWDARTSGNTLNTAKSSAIRSKRNRAFARAASQELRCAAPCIIPPRSFLGRLDSFPAANLARAGR